MIGDCNICIEFGYSAIKAVTELSPSQVVSNISNTAKNSEATAPSFANYKAVFYCPQSFSGGGLYSKQNGLLLWSVIGDCDYGVCGYCNAFDLVTVRKLDWLL